ncbi:hypothetical protein MUO71_06845 [Candidatus Bathyarchaeota archaeon]|nr:hypothetical protein [Candidatus Bathyarchaeota archaeon]
MPERTILKLKQTLLLLDKPTRLRDGNVTAIQQLWIQVPMEKFGLL